MFWVYPRAYGEAARAALRLLKQAGLSPRLRGSQVVTATNRHITRSIPAPTGKPPRRYLRHVAVEVYPRAYGEAVVGIGETAEGAGLSPRLRGSRSVAIWVCTDDRSIPAPTGKPPPGTLVSQHRWVYPRAYGEALQESGLGLPRVGLSPRLRGSPAWLIESLYSLRSIPAPTGKPLGKMIMDCSLHLPEE